jgi:hypothetical protein
MCRGMMGLGLCAWLLLPSLVLANEALPPDLKKDKKAAPVRLSENVPITITYDKEAKGGGRLMIPKKYMVMAAADADRVPRADASSNRMLFAGLALSAAVVTGGLWFVRRSGKGARGALALFILSSALTFTAFVPQVTGNAGPPPELRLLKLEIAGNTAKLGVDVVIVPDGDRVELVLPGALAPAQAK